MAGDAFAVQPPGCNNLPQGGNININVPGPKADPVCSCGLPIPSNAILGFSDSSHETCEFQIRKIGGGVENTGRCKNATVCAPGTTRINENGVVKCKSPDIAQSFRCEAATEQAWGDAGAAGYPAGARIQSARNPAPQPLDDFQKCHLRPHFGSLVDNVKVSYNAQPLEKFEQGPFKINLGQVDAIAQTFCNTIYFAGPYNSQDKRQMVILSHEMVHSRQCQNLGGAAAFGRAYFIDYKRGGYDYNNIRMEIEAYDFDRQFSSIYDTQTNCGTQKPFRTAPAPKPFIAK